ncbi:MAG: prolyl-tRNA synthetase associated domain-containing protein [Rhodospirillales bacterium]|nr:prolyl-tRNA synthetase associated domain-containing protein [Rhodospirillales bacterium]MCW8862713.1 prolyl-tRNA synthetase associated domain-containing protein [Rhodospirillales bacterium]MCW8952858.1 prolyl-tRNA synthetase associated domain-containing protein [Rhodospirillales bacterium]MCW8970640.1 prolyl-tRNA synthetase associated domain-containing protein [Rhodospirillales bacterium]MCW9002837.1 prolyl-tRNA synthetase associated domain-containing protein [Rhodospirillales bacterium]
MDTSKETANVRCTPERLLETLSALGIAVDTFTHPPIMTVEDGTEHWRDIPGVHCKNLFLKDAKGVYWLIVAPVDRAIALKTLPERIGSKRLSFAQPERLREVLGVEPGSVTPFALINDVDRKVRVVLDHWMMQQPLLTFHPLVNTMTTAIRSGDLLQFIGHTGHDPDTVALGLENDK